MIKRVSIVLILLFLFFQGAASAVETEGEVIFRDSLYGAAIGALLGTAFYLADQDDFAQKLAVGVIVGTAGGLIYGVYETTAFVEIEKDEVKFAVPTPVIQKKDQGYLYSASLLKTKF